MKQPPACPTCERTLHVLADAMALAIKQAQAVEGADGPTRGLTWAQVNRILGEHTQAERAEADRRVAVVKAEAQETITNLHAEYEQTLTQLAWHLGAIEAILLDTPKGDH